MNPFAQQIITGIEQLSNPKKAEWQENYVKHNTKAYGVGIPDIRKIVKQAEKEHSLGKLTIESQISVLDDLMKHNYTEPKLAAILYIQLFWKKDFPNQGLDTISNWFDRHWIFDWNICDWLCVRILSPLMDRNPEIIIPVLEAWQNDSYLWKSRAALVPFAQSKSIAKYKELIESISMTLIRREERFCKTAVGWVLRQYSKIDKDFVVKFLSEHENYTTKEVVKNAMKYLK